MSITFVLALSVTLGSPPAQATAPAAQPAPAARAADVDARWAPWLGCWRPDTGISTGTRVCLVPGAAGSVRRLTIAEGQLAAEEPIIADATPHAIEDRDCRGTERAHWLSGQRLVRAADLTCAQDTRRTMTSLSFFVPGPVWVEAQTVDAEGTRSVRVQRYRRAADQQLPVGLVAEAWSSSRAVPPADASESAWTIDTVIEASKVLPAELVEAALTEVHIGFPLNGKALVRLADAGVASRVIDLMVALSNPKKFVVRRADEGEWPGLYEEWPGLESSIFETMRYAGLALPGFYEPMFGMWDYTWNTCVGFWTCSNYYPWWDFGYGYYPGDWVPVYPPISGGGGGGGEAPQHGRVVKGQGYTRGEGPAAGQGYTHVSVRADPAAVGAGTRGSSSGGSPAGSSGSSGGSATPSGYSSGSSGSSGGDRTAQPRGPGR